MDLGVEVWYAYHVVFQALILSLLDCTEKKLLIYLSALVTERNHVQQPIYFVRKTLQHVELNYPKLEKLALAPVFSARRLQLYFQSHIIHVQIDQPLRQVLHKAEIAGRLVKWSVELSEFDIRYQKRGLIKSQFLADFIVELTIPTADDHAIQWTLYVDGASNPQGCGAGIRLEGDDGFIMDHSLHLSFKASNNQTEYEALIAGLRLCLDLNISVIKVYCDSLVHQDWQSSFVHYLKTGEIPSDVENAKKFRRQASFFTLFNDSLYMRGFSRPLLKYLSKNEAEVALSEAHEGICGIHTGAQTLSSKVLCAKFFWPTLQQDSCHKVRNCENYQKHAPIMHTPAEQLHLSDVSWPFNRWGIDILGPFPMASG
ncbi:uncharacterized protein [Arachis hypogaea]|uniref:uncharacterized protein n=1 Tax=Arachis hypogaea TaxID=3818 RepID=UPI003B216958